MFRHRTGVRKETTNEKPLDEFDKLIIQVAELTEVRAEEETADGEQEIESKKIDSRNEYMQDEAC
ncbi:MAG: hypothetical protein SGPRY_014222 [Prymnesium sp.]